MKSVRKGMKLAMLFWALLLGICVQVRAEEPASGGSSSEESALPVCSVRFSGQGLYVYADPSLSGAPTAVLPDTARVQVVLGPMDSIAGIRVCDTGLEGYVDIRYLKRSDAIVEDYDIYTYEEMEEDIRQLQARYPELLRVDTAGTSVDGRNLYVLTMGGKNASQHILVHAGIHAREYMNPLLVMEQLEQCLEYYESGSFHGTNYRNLFSDTAVHIIPMVNPDGIALSQFGESALRSPELVEMVRICYVYDTLAGRTDRPYDSYLVHWKANARGVDLNKNFPFGFGIGTSAVQPSYAGYGGLMPFSEPEAASLGAVTLQYRPTIVISYHSMGEVAYWDTSESPYTEINRGFSSYMLSLVPYKRMGSGGASGSYLDWLYSGETPVRSITFETGNTACPLPAGQYPRIWLHHESVLQAAAWYACAGL